MFPGKVVRKLRFAHVFPGLDHKGINEHLLEKSSEKDNVALFGLSNSQEDIDYTVSELESGLYAGLKMYYIASNPPKYKLEEYFPEPILRTAEKEGVPIILHLPHSLYRSDMEVITVAQRYPRLKIVLAHVGVAHVPKPELATTLSTFGKYPNIYADTARVHSAEIVAAAVHHLGKDRIVYGSDEPLNLLRSATYFNPDLQAPRLLTDYPYHWADLEEQAKWLHLAPRFVHSQWEQLEAISNAADLLCLNGLARQTFRKKIFSENAKAIFNF